MLMKHGDDGKYNCITYCCGGMGDETVSNEYFEYIYVTQPDTIIIDAITHHSYVVFLFAMTSSLPCTMCIDASFPSVSIE